MNLTNNSLISNFGRSLLAGATVGLTTLSVLAPAIATPFQHQEVEQNRFVALAAPYGVNQYKLFILEQKSDARPCWAESGSNPIKVNPLLLTFDFTGICGRNDTNGYSIRSEGQDLGWRYDLIFSRRGNEIVLLGMPVAGVNASPLEIGKSYGIGEGYLKIILNPEWRFTKRSLNNQVLGHIYLTSGQTSSSGTATSGLTTAQLLSNWGWTPINCTPEAAYISFGQAETVCVNSTAGLPPGQYHYNKASNQLMPVNSSPVSSPSLSGLD